MSYFSVTPQFRIYRPLIPVVIAVIAGIAWGTSQPGLWRWGLAGALIASILLGIQILHSRHGLVWPLALCILAGYLSIQPWLDSPLPDNHVVRYADSGYWKIEGVVAARPVLNHRRWALPLDAHRLTGKDRSVEVCGRIRVTGRGEWPGAEVGDRVSFRGRLKTIRSFKNPGGFDYERYMQFKGIRARVYASANSLKVDAPRDVGSPLRLIHRMGEQLALLMDATLTEHSVDTRRLLKTLILGQRDQITPELRDQFNRAGVGHVLAISGLHVGMVATVSFALATWLLTALPWVVKRAWGRKGAALVSISTVLVYGVLAGLSPSTQRAICMVALVLLGLWIGRRHDWLNTLALAALIIVVVYPPVLMTISFQLSFAAVLAIIAGSKRFPLEGRIRPANVWSSLRYRFVGLLWVSAMAILGTLPLVLHYFNQASVVGLALNLIIVPLVGLVVLPAGMLGAAVMALHPTTGFFIWRVAALGADLICWCVQQAAAWPWAAVHTVTPGMVDIVLFYLSFLLWIFWKRMPRRAMAAIILATLCLLDVGYWLHQRFGRDELRVTALDVGQASANLLELPGGYTILVDGGGFSDNSIFDVGARVLAPILWRKKIRTVDLVVLTHANSDHLNGLLYILEHFHVAEVWSNGESAPTKAYRSWAALIAEKRIRHVDFQALPRQVNRHGVGLEILAPPRTFLTEPVPDGQRDLNNNSLVLRVGKGGVTFLFTGDIMTRAESDLVTRIGGKGLRSTVLIVPHHGSRTSSSKAFVSAVSPAEAIISAGWQNRFRLPNAETIQRLESAGCRIWCTANSGAVEVVTDGKSYTVRAFRFKTP